MSGPRLSSLSVGSKLAFATVALLILVSAGVYVGLTKHERESLISAKETAGRMVVELFAAASAAPLEFDDAEAVKTELHHLALNEEVIYANVWGVQKPGGDGLAGLLGDDEGEKDGAEKKPEADGGPAKLNSLGVFERKGHKFSAAVPTSPFKSTTEQLTDRIVFVRPVKDTLGNELGVTRIEFSLAKENAQIAASERRILMGSLGIAMAIAGLLIGISRQAIVKPLAKLLQATKDLQSGQAVELDVRSDDEVGRLSRAFGTMADAIQEREQRIVARNEDMRLVLDNVDQGFITVDREGHMSAERSRIVSTWLGEADENETIWGYLGRKENRVALWFEASFSCLLDGLMPIDVSLDQMPKRMAFDHKHFGIEYIPIGPNLEDDEFEQLVVVISDITAEVEARLAERSQRELLTIFDAFGKDKTAFLRFYEDAAALVDAVCTRDESERPLLLREVHTLKGNSAIYGIASVADHCHELETAMMESDDCMPTDEEKQTLRELWTDVQTKVEKFTGPGGVATIDVLEDDYSELLTKIQEGRSHSELATLVERWRYESTTLCLERVAEQVRTVAERLARDDLEVHTHPNGLWLDPQRWGGFWANFIHVVRNSVDHGIESSDERQSLGKGPGQINLTTSIEGENFVITARDDGRGVAWEKLRSKAQNLGMAHETQDDLVAVMMSDGVSTREQVSDTSGRGVGMAAVLSACNDLGGKIEVLSEAGKGTSFRFVFPTSSMHPGAEEAPTALAS